MTKDKRIFFIEWFDRYIKRYGDNKGVLPAPLQLKYTHSQRVAENARQIAIGLKLDNTEILLAEICGLFHDIGRFLQYERFGSFRDADTLDHGLAGRQVLEAEGIASYFSANDWARVSCAVEYHNRKTDDIPSDLPAEAKKLLKLIRDADKLDIMDLVLQSVARDGFRELPDMLPHISLIRELTPAVLEEFHKNKAISTGSLATVTDFLVMLATWFYDFNYAPSWQLAASRKIIERLGKELPDSGIVRSLLEDIKRMCPNKKT
jgi:hypothetical protein